MSLQELKDAVIELTSEERFELEAFLQHLAHKDDPSYLRELDEASERITSGKGHSLDDVRKLIATFEKKR
jgi:signal recognition particle GTPase